MLTIILTLHSLQPLEDQEENIMAPLSNLNLVYFGLPGRAESIRLALKIGGIPFTDTRVGFPEWKEMKDGTPWGALPYVELSDGTVIAQQRAILRLVGKETGLYPADPIAAAKCDELLDACDDLQNAVNKVGQGMEQEAKDAARKEAVETGAVAGSIKKLDAYIAKNGSGGHSVGDELTIADIFILCVSCAIVGGIFDGVPEGTFDPYKNIQSVRKTTASHPKIISYLNEMKDEKFYGVFATAQK